MEQTTISGYKVMIFHGYDGTQLFINDPSGQNIYAHRVSGDAIERAKEIIGRETNFATTAAAPTADRMICLSDRKGEFAEALARAGKSDLEVFADWERDTFVVVNNDKANEYKVIFETRADGKLYGDCECGDFTYRKRICKHIGEVLAESLFSAAARN